jgi:hypothetical protein
MMKKILAGFAVAAFAVSAAGASAATYNFTRDLTIGSTGADVVALQDVLISNGYLSMPAGTSKGYFGTLTKTAVMKWQASAGITPAAGYFGPVSRAKLSMVDSSDDSSDDSDSEVKGGDGDFRQFDVLGNPSNEDVEEGETIEVLGFEFEAFRSDLKIERVDVLFAETGSDEDKPWKVLEEVLLVDEDGKELASVDASDTDSWEEEENDEYSIRFDDVEFVAEDGEEVQVFVAVTASDDLDTDEQGSWSVELMDDGVRAINGEGIDVYEGSSDDNIDGDADEREFTLEAAEPGSLDITVDEDNNEDDQIEVDEDKTTDEVVIYTATIDSEDGDNLIEEISVDLATTTATVGSPATGLSDIIKTVYLYVDGDEVGSETVASTNTDTVTFDDLEVEIAEDDEIEVTVVVDVKKQDSNFANGDGVLVSAISVDYVDEQDDDFTETDSTDGGDITFSVDALTIEASAKRDAVAPLASNEAQGRFFVEFKVTAPDNEDIYIPKGATTSTAVASGQGAEFRVVDGNGSTVTATTTAANSILARVSGGSETGNYYKVTKGNTVTFRAEVVVDNTGHTEARTVGIQVTGVNYKVGSAATADTQYTAGLDEDFRSETAYLLTSNTQN